jgi:hypothetical protein
MEVCTQRYRPIRFTEIWRMAPDGVISRLTNFDPSAVPSTFTESTMRSTAAEARQRTLSCRANGTVSLVVDIRRRFVEPANLTVFNNQLYFTATDSEQSD